MAKSGHFIRTDLIFDWSSEQFLPAGRFTDVEPYLPPKSLCDLIEDKVVVALGIGAVLVVGVGALTLLESILLGKNLIFRDIDVHAK